MNDYGGLGIVIEEKESPSLSRYSHRSNSVKSNLSTVTTSNIEQRHNRTNSASNITNSSVQNNTGLANSAASINSVGTSAANNNISPNADINEIHHSNSTSDISNGNTKSEPIESEILLPPLPDEAGDVVNSTSLMMRSSVSDLKSLSNNTNSNNSHHNHSPSLSHDESADSRSSTSSFSHYALKDEPSGLNHSNAYSDFFAHDQSFSNYALDSPSLMIDSNFQLFPSVSSSTTNNGSLSGAMNPASSNSSSFVDGDKVASPSNSSPLKRLKSIKNGIRKLSMSSSKDTTNSNTSSTSSTPTLKSQSQQPNRPVLNPLQIDTWRANDITSAPAPHFSQHTPHSSHSSTSSSSSFASSTFNSSVPSVTSGTHKKSRSRTISNALLTPVTPTFTSPIITISENLSSTKKTLSNIEQNYIDSLNTKYSNSVSISSRSSSNASDQMVEESDGEQFSGRGRIESISELSNAEDLVSYASFLEKQKQSITDAFELTRKHLTESGWCSDHDLNNLQLQQDSSLCQLDTKLIQIEERLNRQFGVSLLNNKQNSRLRPKNKAQLSLSNEAKEASISPSLKVLESRCFSFTDSYS
ncbi:uncharacterized protein RJT20DRAFT_124372 [Scheffersomyces xylosifermentans]|uniref:uncharacterized protein n=1 Tax=Scheffersomyces xylosifermentans TaxID=1304137 RepID=UPI00315D14B9